MGLTDTEHGQVLHSGQRAPVSGFYVCDCGKEHCYSTAMAGYVLPPGVQRGSLAAGTGPSLNPDPSRPPPA